MPKFLIAALYIVAAVALYGLFTLAPPEVGEVIDVLVLVGLILVLWQLERRRHP